MRNKLKLWLHRFAIRQAIRLVDAIESQCFTWQTELREELNKFAAPVGEWRRRAPASVTSPVAGAGEKVWQDTESRAGDDRPKLKARCHATAGQESIDPSTARREYFADWQARRAGFELSPPKPRRRRGISSSEFNRRMAIELEKVFQR